MLRMTGAPARGWYPKQHLTPVKQNGVAWEIHFKSNKKKSNGTKKSSGASKKVSLKELLMTLYLFD